MTSPRHRSLAVLSLCVVALAVAGVATPAAATGSADVIAGEQRVSVQDSETDPVIQLWLNGDRTAGGNYELVTEDPTLRVNASVGQDTSGATMQTLTIRINRQTYRSYDLSSENGSVTVDLPVNRGNNTVRIIAEDSAGHVSATEFQVGKDDVAPWIGLTSPFESPLTSLIPNGSVDGALTDIGFRVGEFTAVREGNIGVRYQGQSRGTTVDGPDTRFSREVLLGDGQNTVTITLTDAAGNSRLRQFTLNASDTQAPNISLGLYPQNTTAPSFDLSGTVTDDFWVKNVTINVTHVNGNNITGRTGYERTIRPNTEYRHARSGLSVAFEENLDLRVGLDNSTNPPAQVPGENRIEIVAYDHLGNRTNRTITINRLRELNAERNDPPRISLSNDTRLQEDGRLRVVTDVTDRDWNIRAVEIEIVNESVENGEGIADYELFANLESRRAVTVDTTMDPGPNPRDAVLEVRARDDVGESGMERYPLSNLLPGSALSELTPQPTPTTESPTPTEVVTNDTATAAAEETATATATQTSVPTATPTAETPAISGATNTTAADGGDGGLIGTVVDFLVTVAPFLVGGLVFATIAFVVLRRVRG